MGAQLQLHIETYIMTGENGGWLFSWLTPMYALLFELHIL
jgi:hypothetical protein